MQVVVLLQKISIIAVSLLGLFLLWPQSSLAADVLLNPASGSYASGQTFTVTVQVDPKGESVNAVEASLSFDPSVLSVVNVSRDGSAFSLWTTEPTFSNSDGTVTFGGGSPSPFSSRSNLVSITFQAGSEGTGSVSFSDASVVAADGMGTEVIEAQRGAEYTIATSESTPEPEPEPETTPPPANTDEDDEETIAFGDPPQPPEVGSQAFLDSEVWYNETEGVFTWELPFDVTAVRVELATSSDHVPSEVFDPPIETFTINEENALEGVQYISVQYENQVGWGAVTNRKLMIDTKAPKAFEVDVRPGTRADSFPQVTFQAEDETSGIDYYELTVADQEPRTITPDEAKLGFMLSDLEDGTYTVTVTAYDKAGNKITSSAAVLVTAGWTPDTDEVAGGSIKDLFTGTNILLFALGLIILSLLAYIVVLRRQFAARENKLRKETKEVQEQMEKIFSALRDEIYDQILTITKRPRLSKKEKSAVEGLNQALEVSETLIEKEVTDVKSLLK